jgi:hypothetical protein
MISPHLLRVEVSYSYRTYSGWLEGNPSYKTLVAGAKQRVKNMWGDRAIFVVESLNKNKKLPEWTHIVWANGPAQDSEKDGSELVIIFFSEMSPDTDRVLQVIDWEKHATDYYI